MGLYGSSLFAHFRFVDKLTDFLRSFVGNHLRRFEGSAQFPVIEFLALVYKYTFLQASAISCLPSVQLVSYLNFFCSTHQSNSKPETKTSLDLGSFSVCWAADSQRESEGASKETIQNSRETFVSCQT